MTVFTLWSKAVSTPDPDRVRKRFMLIAVGLLILIALPTMLIFYYYQEQMVDRMIHEQGHGVLSNYNSQTRDSIEKGQRKSFVLAMNNIAQLEGVKYTTLYNDDRMMNYRSGEVTVGIPFAFDTQGELVNPNLELYEQTRGMYLRPDWSLTSRMDSPGGRLHLDEIMGQPCADCHYVLAEDLAFDDRHRAERIDGQEVHFFESIPVESKCLMCHTYWTVGDSSGVLGVTMDRSVFLQQAFESTRQLFYFLLFNALLILAVTYLVATMYQRVLRARLTLAEKSKRLTALLDNSGQGFLSCCADLLIEPDYSRECETFFGSELTGRPVAGLLFPGNSDEADRFSANIRRVINATDSLQRHTFMSLLPRTFACNHRTLEVDYRLIDADLLMLIVTDITEKLRLEARIAEEQTRLRLIVTAATDADELFELLDDYHSFSGETFPALLQAPQPAAVLAEIYRQVHTFKGLFAQLEFIHLPHSLHQFESRIRVLRAQHKEQLIDLALLTPELKLADQALTNDLTILEDTLGTTFFARRGHISLSPDIINSLEALADRLLLTAGAIHSMETRELVQKLKRLRHASLASLLVNHSKTSVRIAEQLGKELAPFAIDDQGIMVSPETYLPFCKSLIHVFRNAVDHGLETPEERMNAGKDEVGQMSCRIWLEQEHIHLEIADDGRGFDTDAIRQQAVKTGRYSAEFVTTMSTEQIWLLIFEDDFSTRSGVTQLSGRGVGLAAVRQETERLRGTIEISSVPGQGTRFLFRLPDEH